MHLLLALIDHGGVLLAESREVDDQPIRIGADPAGDGARWKVPWGRPASGPRDRYLSRDHLTVRADGGHLVLERVEPAGGRSKPNALHRVTAAGRDAEPSTEPLRLAPGEAAAVGGKGGTHFICLRSEADREAVLATLFPASALASAEPGDYAARYQLRLLREELPSRVLAAWSEPEELFTRMGEFLQFALGSRGVAAAFCAVGDDGSVEILNEDPSLHADFTPSRSNLEAAVAQGGERCGESPLVFIAPVASPGSRSTFRDRRGRPVWLYLEAGDDTDPEVALPFARLLLGLTGSLLDGWQKQRTEEQLSRYFSPGLRKLVLDRDPAELEPRIEECTVLFCDRRGSSKAAESGRDDAGILDRLRENGEMLERVSDVVFEHEGVIADFAGDGVLAFWGWPAGHRDHATRAARAAAEIAKRLAPWVEENPGDGRRFAAIRVGISTGRVAVGMTGVRQQRKIGVFGSAVNFGARLEGLGKQFLVPVLISEETARHLGDAMPVRRICRIRPAGFDQAYPVHELVLPREHGGSGADAERIAAYEQALEEFTRRDWNGCRTRLRALPVDDEPTYWLERQVAWFQAHGTPEGWQGEVSFNVK